MDDVLKNNISSTSTWKRLLYMALFAIIYWLAEIVLAAVIILQFLFVLFSGHKNDQLLRFGAQLSQFMYAVFRYLTFNSETKPFPFADWPDAPPADNEPHIIVSDTPDGEVEHKV